MWRYGCPESSGWDGDVELDSEEEVEEEEQESAEDRLRQVIESPLWALVRDFLTPDDVLRTRTTGVKWNVRPLCRRILLPLGERWNGQVCNMTTDNSMDSTMRFLDQGSYLTELSLEARREHLSWSVMSRVSLEV